jgi:hypothetical protein
MKLIVIGKPSIGHDIAIYLGQHNIPFITPEEFKETKPDAEKVLVIQDDTKLSDLIQVIEHSMQDNVPFTFKSMPRFEDLDYVPTLKDLKKDLNKPFYEGVYSRGGKKRGKKFGR